MLATDIQPLEASGGISGRVAQERRSDREVAKATFETACEESKFEASQARDKTQATLKQAERLLAVSRQRLQALGDSDTESDNSQKIVLNDLVIRAPFDGDIEERFIVAGAHISSGQTLFVLANTNTLW